MLADGPEPLERAHREGWALAAFSVYNLELIQAVLRAAEAEGLPVIVQAGSSAFRYAGREPLAALALAAAASSSAAVGVHLDHCHDLGELQACLQLGYSSVMIDGSALPFAENVALTRRAAELAHAAGAWIEGELGPVGGDEDRSGNAQAGELTDPDAAARFAEQTGVDALAVAIGNVHGMGSRPVALDLERLAAIHERTPIPLVLHGASGLTDEQVAQAIGLGVAKLNVNTELRRAFRDAVLRQAEDSPAGDDIASLLAPAVDAVQAVAQRRLRAFARPVVTSTQEPR